MYHPFETERLVIRPLHADDLATLYPLIYADPAVAASFTMLTEYEAVSRTHQKKVQYNQAHTDTGYGYWAVCLKHSPQPLIGQLPLGPPEPMPWIVLPPEVLDCPLAEEVELGYAFGRPYWGQGYATEAAQALLRHAFEEVGVPRLVESVLASNTASIRLLERLGFVVVPNENSTLGGVVGILTRRMYQGQQGRAER